MLDRDDDEDGWTKTTDCDETDPAVQPTANELLGNGVDDDCDASTPDAPPGGLTGSMRSWGSNHNVPRDCRGARAARAAKEVRKARRRAR